MKIFGQTPNEFFRSKSNWTGLAAIAGAITAYSAGQIDTTVMTQGVFAGLALIFVKDAVVKTGGQ